MTTDARIWLMIFGILIFAVAVASIGYAFGQTTSPTAPVQQQVQDVKEEVQGTSAQVDATTAGLGVAGAGMAATFVKTFLDNRKSKGRDSETDARNGRFAVLVSKFFQAKYLYPYMTDKEILDLPISNNPMSKLTLGQAITAEADGYTEHNQAQWNIPQPQMSVPTLTTVEAVKGSNAGPPTQPPPPGGNKQESKPAAQDTSSSANTNKPGE